MSRGITIKITRPIETRERWKDEVGLRIWTGTRWKGLDSLPNSPGLAYIYGNKTKDCTTAITLLPPGTLPPAALGYPRLLPRKILANDNAHKTGQHKNAGKAILLRPKADRTVKTPPAKTASYPRSYATPDELEEALLRRLSKQFFRHVFVNTDGHYGYIDESMQFIAVD